MSILAQLTLSSGASGYIDLYIQTVGRADLIIETVSTSNVPSITLLDGDGPASPNVAMPFQDIIPYTTGVNQHGTTSNVFWDTGGTSYNLSTRISNRQTISIGLNRPFMGNWLSILIPTVAADTQINVRGYVS